MGKRAKLAKLSNNKAYNTVMKSRRKNKLVKVLSDVKNCHTSNNSLNKIITKGQPNKPQLRHRRVKDRTILSRGQKRRMIKKFRKEIRKNIPNKVGSIKKNTENKTVTQDFDMKDINQDLDNIFQENTSKKIAEKNVNVSKKQKMQQEKDKIFKALENSNFNMNPFETIKQHLSREIFLKEKNTKMEEQYKKMEEQMKNIKN